MNTEKTGVVESTIGKIEALLQKECGESTNFYEVFMELKEKYDPGATIKEITSLAGVRENAIRESKKKSGPCLEACLKLALALGIDNLSDIDYLLEARGYCAISDGINGTYTKYRTILEVILAAEELLPEEAIEIFDLYQ
ncbi:MAG: hypothetical protein V8R80_08420 [Eubacterium sp.]